MFANKLDDLPDPLRDGLRIDVEVVGPGYCDVRHGFVNFKELQAMSGEFLAQNGRHLEGKALLVFPGLPDEPRESLRTDAAAGVASQMGGLDLLDDIGSVNLAKMFFDFVTIGQLERLRNVQANVLGLPALF